MKASSALLSSKALDAFIDRRRKLNRSFAAQFPAAINEGVERFALQLGAAASIGQDVDEESCGIVIGNGNHFAQSALNLWGELSLAIGLHHEEQFHERGRIKGSVAVVIGADRRVGLREVDYAEGKIVGGEAREIFQRRFGRVRQLRAKIGIDRNGFEFPEVSESYCSPEDERE